MSFRVVRIVLLAALFALTTSVTGFAQVPCGVANEIYCQYWDTSSVLYAAQNDTNTFGNFATVYDNFNFAQTWDVESFHLVGGYFSPATQAPITAWTLTFYAAITARRAPCSPPEPFPETVTEPSAPMSAVSPCTAIH